MKEFNIDEADFEEIKSEATVILNILNGTSASSGASTGGGKKGGNIRANAYESLFLESKNVTIDGKQSMKIMTSGLITMRGGLGTQMFSPLIEGISRALSKNKLPEPGEVGKEDC